MNSAHRKVENYSELLQLRLFVKSLDRADARADCLRSVRSVADSASRSTDGT
jgi:hypothetical protein